MNERELDTMLKSAPVPERTEKFWAELPKGVTARLRRASEAIVPPRAAPQKPDLLDWALGLGLVGAVAIISLLLPAEQAVAPRAAAVAAAAKCYRETEALFPNQVQAIIFDEVGPRVVLAEKADVPASPPLYLKICGPRGCQEIVTFSGQQIRVNGEDCDVLADAAGGVILAGDHLIWSSHAPRANRSRYQIEACPLEVAL